MDIDKKSIEQNFPEFKITEKTSQEILNNTKKHEDCDARTKIDMFRTEEEQQKYIEDSLERSLPGEKTKVKKLIKKTDKK